MHGLVDYSASLWLAGQWRGPAGLQGDGVISLFRIRERGLYPYVLVRSSSSSTQGTSPWKVCINTLGRVSIFGVWGGLHPQGWEGPHPWLLRISTFVVCVGEGDCHPRSWVYFCAWGEEDLHPCFLWCSTLGSERSLPSELGDLRLWVMGIFFPEVARVALSLELADLHPQRQMSILGRSPYMRMVAVVGSPSLKVLPAQGWGNLQPWRDLHVQRTSVLDPG